MSTNNIFAELRQLVAQDELDLAISQIQKIIPDSRKLDETILQSARYKAILKQIRVGIVDEQQAELTKNKIRTALLELIRELESNQFLEHEHADDYKKIVEKIKTNRGIGTSKLLKNKTTKDLDEKELPRLFEKERAILMLNESGKPLNDLTAHQKLLLLSLAENGHLFKGTFLCLGQRNQIRTICHSAVESKFILFKGTDRVEILVLETLTGNLLQQFEKMMMLLRVHIPLGRNREKSEDVYEIPILALREFVANAFVHRDYGNEVNSYIQIEIYDDRIEIKSPGHLPPSLNVHNIQGTILVNPVVAAIFLLYKHIEQAGTGIKVAQQILKSQNLKPAQIENIDSPLMTKVTIFRHSHSLNIQKNGNVENQQIEELKAALIKILQANSHESIKKSAAKLIGKLSKLEIDLITGTLSKELGIGEIDKIKKLLLRLSAKL